MLFRLAAFLAAAAACAPTRRLPTPPLAAVRAGRHAVGSPRDDLVLCPTPGCMTPLKPGKVAGHLVKCPVLAEQRALESSGYYRRAVNSGDRLDDDEHDGRGEASALTPALEARLIAAHATECSGLLHTPATLALLEDEDGGGANQRERQRQRLQRRAIADQLAALDLLGHGHCLVGMGAPNPSPNPKPNLNPEPEPEPEPNPNPNPNPNPKQVELGAGNGELSLAIAEAYPEVHSKYIAST